KNWEGSRELCQESPEPLTAECTVVALSRAGKIRGRHLRELFAAAIRAQHKFDGRAPFAEILGQRLGASDVALARGIGNGGIGSHEAREKILHLSFAGVATSDAHSLPRRRRVDLDPGLRGELRQGIDVGRIDPVCAAIVGYAEYFGVGDAAPADVLGGLEHNKS